MNKKIAIALFAVILATTGCSGIRTAKAPDGSTTFVTHAEAFRVLGYAIPGDDQEAAMKLVPKGAVVETVQASPADWSSLFGVIGNIFWIHGTQVGGTVGK